jgi:hypothetical protein
LAAGPEVISEEVTVRTSDAPSGGCTSNCGGGGSTPSTPSGGGGGGYIVPPDFAVEDDLPTTCSEYLLEYIRLGWANNPLEVVKLQVFLNYFEGFNLPITGVYTLADFNAVSIFQARYGRDILGPWGIDDSTGFVFITTRMAINNIVCHLSTENNLDLRNFYLQAAARLGLNVPATVPPAYVPTNVGVGTSTRTYCLATLADCKAHLFFERNRGNEFYREFCSVAWHYHFYSSGKSYITSYVCSSNIELRFVTCKERSVASTFFLFQDVHFTFKF